METQFLDDNILLGQEEVDTEVQEEQQDPHLLRTLSTQRPVIAYLEWRGQQFPIYQGDNLIGGDEVCEIRLNHKSVCGKHAVLLAESNPSFRCEIRDLRSINGTFLESAPNSDQFEKLSVLKCNSRELSEGGTVRFGMVSCLLRRDKAGTASTAMQETQFLGNFGEDSDHEDDKEDEKMNAPVIAPRSSGVSSSGRKKRFLDDDDTVTDEEVNDQHVNRYASNTESDEEDADGFDPYDIPKASSVFVRVDGSKGDHKVNASIELPTQIDADFAHHLVPAATVAMDTADEEDEEETMSQDLMEPIDEEPVRTEDVKTTVPDTPPMSEVVPHPADVTLDGNLTATETEDEAEPTLNISRKSTLLDTTLVPTQHTASPTTPADPIKTQSKATPSPLIAEETAVASSSSSKVVGRKTSTSSSSSARKGRGKGSLEVEEFQEEKKHVAFEVAPVEKQDTPVSKIELEKVPTPVSAAKIDTKETEEKEETTTVKGRRSLKFTTSTDERYQAREVERLEQERLAEEAAAKKSTRGKKKTEKAADIVEEKITKQEELAPVPAATSKAKGGKGKKAVVAEEEEVKEEVKEEQEVNEKVIRGGKKRKATDVKIEAASEEEEKEQADKEVTVANTEAHSSSSSSSSRPTKRPRGKVAEEEAVVDTPKTSTAATAVESFKIKLLFTKLDEADYAKQLKKIPDVEVTSDPTVATYCITTKELKRTPKLLVSMNSHIRYVLNDQWILDSAKQGKALPIVDDENKYNYEACQHDAKLIDAYKKQLQKSTYLVTDAEKEALWDFNMVDTLTKIRMATDLHGIRQLPGIFKGLAVFCTKGLCGSKAPSEEETQQLIEAGGGLWLKSIQDFPTKHGGSDGSKKKGKSKKDDIPMEDIEELKLIIVSHESMAKKEIKKDMIEVAKQSGAKGIYSVEVIFIAILKQTLDLDQYFIEGYQF